MSEDPQSAGERRVAARHLLTHPLTCEEHDPDVFRLVRRHEVELDRWFTQRLGYRLHVGVDTARLWKMGYLPTVRPLRAPSGRPLHGLELTLLVLALACTAAGPPVISLRDLVDLVRSAAAEADIPLSGDGTDRRALVAALRWMIDHGLAVELHDHIDAYAADAGADAVLRIRPDRIALLPLPAIASDTADAVLASADRRAATRQWLRSRLVEDPVVYQTDLDEAEWLELRRRLGDEALFLDEMFGLAIEARAEGVAAIDPGGGLTDRTFPASGTEGHAALLLIAALRADPGRWRAMDEIEAIVAELAGQHRRHWARDLAGAPDRLAKRVVDLLCEVRLAERGAGPEEMRLLPAAARFVPAAPPADQSALW
jgi:uncharacterized protein (TIGR02678 family)